MPEADDRNPQEANVRVNLVVLNANEIRNLDVGAVRALWLTKSTSLGTSAGEVSIAFGKEGDFLDMSPGDFFRVVRVRWIRLRNNTAIAKSVEIAFSADVEFRAWNTPRGM